MAYNWMTSLVRLLNYEFPFVDGVFPTHDDIVFTIELCQGGLHVCDVGLYSQVC